MEQETPKPKAFPVYLDNIEHYKLLSMQERGELLTAMLEYARDGTMPNFSNPALEMAFSFSRAQIDRDFKSYHDTCVRNRENANKKKKSNLDQSEPVATSGSQSEPVGTRGSQNKEETEKKIKKNLNKNFNNNSKTNNNSESPEEVRLIPFGKHQNVLLTQADVDNLKERFPNNFQSTLDIVSEYVCNNPKTSPEQQHDLLIAQLHLSKVRGEKR